MQHHARDPKSLVQPSGERAHRICGAAPESDPVQERHDSFFRIRYSIEPREEAQIFDGTQVAVEICVVRKKSGVPPRLFRLFSNIDALDA